MFELQGNSVLITGATDLIGTYLVYSLLKLNKVADDKAIIRIITHNGLLGHLEHLASEKNLEIYQGDLSDFAFCASLPESDYIIHAAGYGQPRKFVQDKIKTIRMNTMATDVLLSKLKLGGKFLFISSSEIYSNAKDIPTTETSCGLTMPDHPRACYIEGKEVVYNVGGTFRATIRELAETVGEILNYRQDAQRI